MLPAALPRLRSAGPKKGELARNIERAKMMQVVAKTIQVKPRYLGMALLALLIQQLFGLALTPALGVDVTRVGVLLSYLLLLAFLVANRRHPGVVIVGVGFVMNLAAILANSGHMPVTVQTAMNAGFQDKIAGLRSGDIVPETNLVLLDWSETRLWFLSDVLSIRFPLKRVFSTGDILVAVGIVMLLVQLVLSGARERASTSERKLKIYGWDGRSPGPS